MGKPRAGETIEQYRERHRIKCAEWREKNRERYNAKALEWRNKNKEKVNAQCRERRKHFTAEQLAMRNEAGKRWAKKNRAYYENWRRQQPGYKGRRSPGKGSEVANRLVNCKARAKKAGVEFNLTEEWFLAHFSQGCAVTGIEMEMGGDTPYSVEIDRIVPGGPYTMDNCQLVCAMYNMMKRDWGDTAVLEFLKRWKG